MIFKLYFTDLSPAVAGDQVIDNVLFVDLDQSLKQETVLSTSQVSSIKYHQVSHLTGEHWTVTHAQVTFVLVSLAVRPGETHPATMNLEQT